MRVLELETVNSVSTPILHNVPIPIFKGILIVSPDCVKVVVLTL